MKKRLLSLFVTAAMLFGMLPLTTLGVSAETAPGAVEHAVAYAETVVVDGVLEDAWLLNGKLTDGRAFGTLWNSEALYLAVEKTEADTDAAATINGKALTITADSVMLGDAAVAGAVAEAGSGHWEVKIPWSALAVELSDYNAVLTAELSVGEASWSGDLRISSMERSKFAFSGGTHKASGNTVLSRTDGNKVVTMSNKYAAGANTENSGARVATWLDPLSPEIPGSQTSVVEFVFAATDMPEYGPMADIEPVNEVWVCYGFNFFHGNSENMGYLAGITNTTDEGLVLCVTGGDSGCITAKLGKAVGDTFRMRFERTTTGGLRVYCDDKLVMDADSVYVPAKAWSSAHSAINFNLWSGSTNHLTEDGANDVEFTLSELSISGENDYLLEQLTFDTIKGGNQSADAIIHNLDLPTQWEHPKLGYTYDITWTSSNGDVITTDGVVTPGKQKEDVVLTAAMTGGITKEFALTVPKEFVRSYFTLETVTVDGAMNEISWEYAPPREFGAVGAEGAPTGTVKAMMNKGIAYLAVEHDGANQLRLNLGEKAWTIDLTQAAFSDTGIEAAIAGDVVEIQIDLAALGMPIRDYNRELPIQMVLENTSGTTKLADATIALIFEAKLIQIAGIEAEEEGNAPERLSPTAVYVETNESGDPTFRAPMNLSGTWDIWQYEGALSDLSKPMLLEMNMDVDALAGEFKITYEDKVDSQWRYVQAILTSADGALKLTVKNDTVELGKTVGGAAFKLGLLYKNGGVSVYVDNALVGEISDATTVGTFNEKERVDLRTNDSTVNIAVTNIQVTENPKIKNDPVAQSLPSSAVHGVSPTEDGVVVFDAPLSGYGVDIWQYEGELADLTKPMLLEMNMDVDALSGDLKITYEDKVDGQWRYVQAILTSADGALKLTAKNDTVNLGKTVGGAAFKLGLLYKDGGVSVYVDNALVGEINDATTVGTFNEKERVDLRTNNAATVITVSNIQVTENPKIKNDPVAQSLSPTTVYVEVSESGDPTFRAPMNLSGTWDIWQYDGALSDLTKPMLLEMNMDVDALAGEFKITYEDKVDGQWRYVQAILTNTDGALKLTAKNGTVNLGKNVGGAAFKLGLLYKDGGVSVYVDNALVGEISDATTVGTFNEKERVDLRTNDSTVNIAVTNIQVTENPKIETGPAAEALSHAYIYGVSPTEDGVVAFGAPLGLGGAWDIWQYEGALSDLTKPMLLEVKLDVDVLGGEFKITYEDKVDSQWRYAQAVLTNADGALKLTLNSQTVDLGKTVGGAAFKLGLLYNGDAVSVYVDNVLVSTVNNGVVNGTFNEKERVDLRTNDSTAVITVSNIQVTPEPKLGSEDSEDVEIVDLPGLQKQLTSKVLLKDLDLTKIDADITLPASYNSPYLGNLPLTWDSKNESYLTDDGKVTRPETLNSYVKLSVAVVGGPDLWTEELCILATGSLKDQTPVTIMAPFAKSTTTEWSLNNKVLEGMALNGKVLEGTAAGVFGVKWDLNNLYFAVKTNGKTLGLTVNGKQITVDENNSVTANGITTVTVPYADAELTAPTAYGAEISAEVTLGTAAWEGTLVLTSNEAFEVEGEAQRTIGQQYSGTGVAVQNGGAATAKQKVEKTADGWHFIDHYNSDGKNPIQTRGYLILWGFRQSEEAQERYANFNDRTRSTYLEFDFQTTAMPVYQDGGVTGWSTGFASYGFTWAMAGDNTETGTDSTPYGVSMGIYNTKDGLKMVVLGSDTVIKLNKYVGDTFRIGTRWETDGSLTVFIDGEEFAVVENAETMLLQYGNNSAMLNLIRSDKPAESSNDNMDVYVSNITMAKGYGDEALDLLRYENILKDNEDRFNVNSDLELPAELTNPQTGWVSEITWESNSAAVAVDGKVTVPEKQGAEVTLKAATGGESKTFTFYVPASAPEGNTLICVGDSDTANGVGVVQDVYTYTLDTTNNSIIFDQGESKKVNVITLTDGDAVNRLFESVLTIWVSEDNKTYTRVDDYFKILRDGDKTYLYDFEATGRYIKVHCTHFEGAEADFTGKLQGMIAVDFVEHFGADGAFTVSENVAVSNPNSYIAYDDAWRVALADAGVTEGSEASIRVYLDGELLYHYVDGDEIVVRIPEIAANGSVTLTVLSGNENAMDISNPEGVHEVVYGTREAMKDEPRRWVCALPDGRLFAVLVDTREEWKDLDWGSMTDVQKARKDHIAYSFSSDGGLTWTDSVVIEESWAPNLEEDGFINSLGGVGYDPAVGKYGRIIVTGMYYVRFNGSNMDLSYSPQRFMYSDDLGKTWTRCAEMEFAGEHSPYQVGYVDIIKVSSYDGEGPGVDYVTSTGDQANNQGGFCCRPIYSDDGGLTWTMVADVINLREGSGITSIESGVSEAFIMERESDHALVLYARCQYANSNKFAISYSYDFGKTWTEAKFSTVYASTGQPVMNPFGDANIMIWGGNHALGANSYLVMPMVVGNLTDNLDGVYNIQDLYSRYSFQGMTAATRVQLVNQSADSVGDTLAITSWGRRSEGLDFRMRVDNFTDYLYRTKGIYDSFENSTVKYEGWSVTSGAIRVFDDNGNKVMLMPEQSAAVRSIPYLQDGSVSMKLYLADAAAADFTVELEAAYSNIYGTAAPVAIQVVNGQVVGTELALADGWNTISFELNLSAAAPTAKLTVNGNEADMTVNAAVGAYVCYIDINAGSEVYADEILVIDTMPVEIAEKPEVPATEATIEMHSILLEGNIGVNYWTKISLDVRSDPNAYIQFTMPDGTVTKIPVSEAKVKTYNGETYYTFKCEVAAREMSEQIKAQIFYTGGSSTEDVYSVRAYANSVLNDANAKPELKELVTAMLNYGAYAQKHFNHNTDDLAAEVDGSDIAGVTAETLKAFASTGEGTEFANFSAISLLLKTNTNMRLFFTLDESVTDFAVTGIDGEPLTVAKRNGMHYVDVVSVAAQDLDKEYTVTINDGTNEATVTASALSYCYRVLAADPDDTNLKNLVKALYVYNGAADTYFATCG